MMVRVGSVEIDVDGVMKDHLSLFKGEYVCEFPFDDLMAVRTLGVDEEDEVGPTYLAYLTYVSYKGEFRLIRVIPSPGYFILKQKVELYNRPKKVLGGYEFE